MKYVVSGSHGLVGTALLQHLRSDGHDVARLVRPDSASGGGGVAWDPRAGTIDAAGLEGTDVVVHLAGAGIGDKRWTDARKAELVRSRVETTELLASTLARLDDPPSVMLSASAIGWYGDRGDEVLTERSDAGTGFVADLCARWEAATGALAGTGIRVAHLRTGVVLAPRGGMLGKLVPLFRLCLGGRMGSGRQYLSWIGLDDEIAAIRWLVDHDLAGPVNLTAPAPVTNRAFTAALAAAVGRPAVLPVPLLGPKLLYGGEMVTETIVVSQRILPERLLESGFEFEHPEIDGALAAAVTRQR